MRFRDFFEMEIRKDQEDDMNIWSTPDDIGQLHFSLNNNVLHVDFLTNKDEFDPRTKGQSNNILALVRALRSHIQAHPEIKKITANVQNPDVGRWLVKSYGAKIIKRGMGMSLDPMTGVFQIPIQRVM
jgi:hypothetical protein